MKSAKDLKEFYISGMKTEQPSILKELKELKDLKSPISPRDTFDIQKVDGLQNLMVKF